MAIGQGFQKFGQETLDLKEKIIISCGDSSSQSTGNLYKKAG